MDAGADQSSEESGAHLSGLSAEGKNRFFEQAFELWFTPEIERRKADGSISPDFSLHMAQALFPPDKSPIVRLNEEVTGFAVVRAPRDVSTGEHISLSDLEHLQSFELTDEDFDCGHATIILVRDKWIGTFNFLSRRGRALNLLSKAMEFWEAARHSVERNHASAAVDNLFSACELAAKAELIVTRMIGEETNHRALHSRINNWARLGNIEPAFAALFNSLGQLRSAYRYSAESTTAMPVELEEVEMVRAIIESRMQQYERKIADERANDSNT